MPRLTKIVTRQGDDGETSLSGGQRVSKDSARVSAFGTVDELSSHIGFAVALGLESPLSEMLKKIQNDLFHLGSDLSFLEEDKEKIKIPLIEDRHITYLDTIIEELNKETGPLENFILPGGSLGAAQLHIARTICRRAERNAASLAREEKIGVKVLPYLNRLSDCLFVMARFENLQKGIPEPLWNSRI